MDSLACKRTERNSAGERSGVRDTVCKHVCVHPSLSRRPPLHSSHGWLATTRQSAQCWRPRSLPSLLPSLPPVSKLSAPLDTITVIAANGMYGNIVHAPKFKHTLCFAAPPRGRVHLYEVSPVALALVLPDRRSSRFLHLRAGHLGKVSFERPPQPSMVRSIQPPPPPPPIASIFTRFSWALT